jgi:protoporphyrinogen oxidase
MTSCDNQFSAPAPNDSSVVIIGAGPAGLTAAYLLSKARIPVTVIEADPRYVGGISRTVIYKGYHFDIGGHRFFSKSQEVEQFWDEILPDDMLVRPRSSRIYYRGKFFSYPLRAFEALSKLGILESTLCGLSYLKACLFPHPKPGNFQDWVSNQFGARLFGIFFKTYTEKVWGMNCRDISADWAAQRIKGLSLFKAVWSSLFPPRDTGKRKDVVKTLINSFRYPRKGPGMMWEECTAKVKALGGAVMMGQKVTGCHFDEQSREWTVTHTDANGKNQTIKAQHVISSTPVRQLGRLVTPPLAPAALEASKGLKYRDFLTVALIYRHADSFDDNWIYIHEPHVKVGRIQNFKSWSPEMLPDLTTSCYGLEYFCFEGDTLWDSSDEALIALAKREMETLGLAKAKDYIDGTVVRQPKAYPVYDAEYTQHLAKIREELDSRFPTLHLIGRNGMHKYNNQDHSMMTAMLTAKNIIAGEKIYDVWQVNEDAEYHETSTQPDAENENSAASGLRSVPQRLSQNIDISAQA